MAGVEAIAESGIRLTNENCLDIYVAFECVVGSLRERNPDLLRLARWLKVDDGKLNDAIGSKYYPSVSQKNNPKFAVEEDISLIYAAILLLTAGSKDAGNESFMLEKRDALLNIVPNFVAQEARREIKNIESDLAFGL